MNIVDVDRKFPNLHVLDLRGNKIFSIDAIDILYRLKNLHTVNFSHNPIMVHAHLEEMIMESAPQVETVNNKRIKEIGSKYKEKISRLKSAFKD